MPRDNIVLQCGDCKNRNYFTDKNKKKTAMITMMVVLTTSVRVGHDTFFISNFTSW